MFVSYFGSSAFAGSIMCHGSREYILGFAFPCTVLSKLAAKSILNRDASCTISASTTLKFVSDDPAPSQVWFAYLGSGRVHESRKSWRTAP